MGLFSSKKKHFVDTAVVPVFEPEMIPNMLERALVESIFDDIGIPESVQNQAMNGSFRNFERMYRFARDGKYAYGLPDVNFVSSSDGFDLAKTAIEQEVGHAITLEYLHYRPLNNYHVGWKTITEEWEYDHDANTLRPPGKDDTGIYYLDKMVAVYTTAPGQEPEQSGLGTFQSSSQSGETPERPAQTGALRSLVDTEEFEFGPREQIIIHWIREPAPEDEDQEFGYGSETIDLEHYDSDFEYYQAKYYYNDNGERVWGYWIYNEDDRRFPALDNVFQPPEYTNPGTYFPFVVFRSEDENRTSQAFRDTPEYATSVELLEYIGMDFQGVGDTIHENPDAEDIRQAVMMMGVPITTEDEVQIEYLHRYFADMATRLPGSSTSSSVLPGLQAAPDESYALQISDADFDLTLSFDDIQVSFKAGYLPAGVKYDNNTSVAIANTSFFEWANGELLPPAGAAGRNTRVFRHQVYPGMVHEVRVTNLQFRFAIARDGRKGVEGGVDDERLLVPLDYEICRRMSVLKLEDLYHRSLNFVFNSHVVQKVKWYESGIFKAVLVIVAVVIAFYTGQFQGIAAAAAVGASAVVMAVVTLALKFIIGNLIFQFVLNQVAEVIGAEWATALAVVALVYGGVKGFQSGQWLQNATAKNMLTLANGLIKAAGNQMKLEFSEYLEDVEQFNLMAEEMTEELEEMQKLLDTGIDLSPWLFIAEEPLTVWGESPDAYFNRTVHSGNVGATSLEFIQNFVDVSLRLPESSETLGGTFYV